MMKPEELLTEEQKKAFDEKYGDDRWALITKRNRKDPSQVDFQLAIRAPERPEYLLFKQRSLDKATSSQAQETLVKQCLLHPSAERLSEVVKRFPGLFEAQGITQAIQEWTGMVADESAK